MSDNEDEGSVQFRGLSTHYVASGNMLASFRYPAGWRRARREDWVGLFEEGASSPEQCLARAQVGNTATHRPCDGGLWKAGNVVLRIGQLQGPSDSGYYRLWYVSHETGGVVGRSATFTLCRDMSEFPSITIEGGGEHALLESLRAQSPVSLHSGHCSISSSFVLVDDEQWSHDEDPVTTPPTGEGPVTTPPTGEDPVTTPPTGGEDPVTTPPTGGKELAAVFGTALERVASEPPATSVESSYPNPGGDGQREQPSHRSQESTSNGVSETPQPRDEALSNEDGVAVAAPPSVVREGPPSLSFLRESSLTSSTLVVHGLSQSEAWRIKNSNKELWAKVQKLSAGLGDMQRQREELEGTLAREEGEKRALQERVAELGQLVSELRGELGTAREEKEELTRENTTLQEHVSELQAEVGVVSQHCTRLLERVSEYEAQLAVARSEQEVLRQQKGQRRHKRESPHSRRRGRHNGQHSHSGRGEESREERSRQEGSRKEGSRGEESRKEGVRHKHSTGSSARQEAARLSGERGEERKKETVAPAKQQHVRRQEEGRGEPAGLGGVRRTAPPAGKLSEERICEITAKLKGRLPSYTCPICNQQLPSHESEYSARLHVERCLASQEAG